MPTTLISLVAGMALMGLIAMMAVPSSTALQSSRLEETARQLKSLIRLAQVKSTETGTVHGVVFDPEATVFELVTADLARQPPEILGTVPDPVTGQPARVTLPEGVSPPGAKPFQYAVIGGMNEVFFDLWGTPVNRGASRVQLTASSLRFTAGSRQINVVLSPLTGRMTVN